MHKDSEQKAQDLVSDIELRLSEHSDGLLSEDELKRELASLVNDVVVSFIVGDDKSLFKTAATANTYIIYAPLTCVGISPAVAPA